MRFRALVLAVSLAGALPLCRWLWQPAQAANPPVDAGLLEFLGSVDSDDEDWHQYLAAARRVHKDPVDPPHGDSPVGNPGASGNKPAGSSSSSSAGPPAQHPPPSPSQPDGSSGSNSQSRPPEVNQT